MKIRITKKGVRKFQGDEEPSQVGWHSEWENDPANFYNQPSDSSTCPPGQTYSAVLQKCVTPQEAEAEKRLFEKMREFSDRRKKGLPTNAFKTTGNEGTASNPMNSSQKTATTTEDVKASPFNKFGKKLGAYSALATGLINVGNFFTNYFGNEKKLDEDRGQQYMNNLNPQATEMFRGNYMTNSGVFQPNKLPTPNEGMFAYGGQSNINPMKIRITSAPKMEYGGQSNYGLDLGRRKVYTDMEDSSSETATNAMSEKSGMKVLEAERGETIWRPDGTHFVIGGERHYNNGTKLTEEQAPAGSFIFSDTKKMKIKDPEILAMFGVSYKAGGVTPATIAKKFKLNDYKARLEDKTRESDSIGINSDKRMFEKNNEMLAKLAMVQEAMKGLPAPALSEAILGASEMAYGGYVMPKFQGKKGSSTVPTYQPAFKTTVLEPKKKEDYDLIYPEGFDENMPATQSAIGNKRVYGKEDWTSAARMADFKKRFPEFFKQNPNWDPTKVGSTRKFQEWYNKNVDPSYFSGKDAYGLDDKFGQHTFSAPAWVKKEKPVKKEDPPVEEKKKDPDPDPLKKPDELRPTRQAPFGFLAPDVANLLAAGAIPPNVYMPFSPDMAFQKGQYALPDWLSQAQQLQQTYNIAGDTQATYGPASALASNLSFLAGKTGDAVGQTIANNALQSVGVFNEFSAREQDRKDKVTMYNTMNAKDRYDNSVRARQAYENAQREYLANVADKFGAAWENRGDLYDINMRDPYFYRDPASYKTIFKGNAGDIFKYASGYGTNGAGGLDNLGASANTTYKNIYDNLKDIKDEKRREQMAERLTIQALTGARQTNTQSYDAFGFPKSSSRRRSSLSLGSNN
jgi:hypothetical protein